MAQRKTLTLKTKSNRLGTTTPTLKRRRTFTASTAEQPPTSEEKPATPPVPKEEPIAKTPTEPPSKPRRHWNWESREAALADYKQQLIRNYPTLFGDDPKPLKIGIHKDLLQTRGLHNRKITRIFINQHTRRTDYLQALAKGGPRYDLNNQPAGTVTELQQQLAQRALEKRKAKSRSTKTE